MSGMASLAAARQVTIEEFERMRPAPDRRYELDQGEVLELTFPNPWQNLVTGKLYRLLEAFVRERKLGLIFPSDTGFILSNDPPTLRGPDIAFIGNQRLAGLDLRANIPGAPDLAVEVLSPGDSYSDVRRKVRQYLAAGCRTIWLVDPEARTVEIHEPGIPTSRELSAADRLEAPDLLPGFAILVAELFPDELG